VPDYVRHCPVCDTENPPERARCACGASLAAVDFTLKGAQPAAAAPAAAPAHVDARPLPAALRERYRVVEAFPATGSEADILLVVDNEGGDRAVAKLYRKGIRPDFKLLDILAASVGSTVVRVLDHGVSDGTAYEILEYVPGGTLQALMRSGPLTREDVRGIVREIADALAGIHAHGILHRDLKPENVLVRTAQPLRLALTDFGIASISDATQHFTTAARTTKYAAPEVLTGVLDAKSDWWSLGMIVLEAASGSHPFDGLSEQVMNHQLATRPIDVRGVADDALRTLCRGLLLRDPARRFGRDEVARWLDGDATLEAPEEREASGARPYRFGDREATTGAELALALAKHWDAARRDLARGQVARWLENELHDYNLLRALHDIQEVRGASEDVKLLRFLLAAAPDLPPVWRGRAVAEAGVLAAAREATRGDADAVEWLDTLASADVLAVYGTAGHAALRALDARWREAWEAFASAWREAQRAEAAWRRQPRDVGGGRAVSFDDLVYAAPDRLAMPERRAINGPLLVALHDEAFVSALQGEVVAGLASLGERCPWYEAIARKADAGLAATLAAHAMLPIAREFAGEEERRESASAGARAQARDDAREELRAAVSHVLELAPAGDEDVARDAVGDLLEAFDALQATCLRIERLKHTDEGYEALRRSADKLASFGASAQRALARVEEVRGVNAIFLTPPRLAIGGFVLVGAVMSRTPVVMLVVAAVVALVVGYRWLAGFNATEEALKRLRLFALHGRTFLRAGEKDAGP
jgi:hypothetical protein